MYDEDLTHAGGVVRRAGESGTLYLIVQSSRAADQWVLPKGHIEKRETPEQTTVREIAEEAGVEGEIVCVLGESEYELRNKRVHIRYFLLDYLDEVEATEDREIRWCDREGAIELLSFPDTRSMIELAADVAW